MAKCALAGQSGGICCHYSIVWYGIRRDSRGNGNIFKLLCNTSCWVTANLLNLNSSITEFLLIGFQQLAKILNCSLFSAADSARNLGFIFDSHLTFSDQISALFLNLAIIIFVNFSVSAHTLTSKLPVPLSHPLFTMVKQVYGQSPPGQLPPVRSPLFLATPVKRPQMKCHMRSKAP